MNHFFTSTGERVSKATIDRRVRQAKAKKLEEQKEKYGYNFCEDCFRNDCKPVDCSHDKSVDWCQKNSCVELAWDVNNITLRGRKCHQKHDKLNIQSSKLKSWK